MGSLKGTRMALMTCSVLLCGVVVAPGVREENTEATTSIGSLSLAAQAAISAAIGRDQQIYHMQAIRDGFRLQNPRSDLAAEFNLRGVRVLGTSKAGLALSMVGYGYGDHLHAAAGAEPKAVGNRVEYQRGTLAEWYVNGPAGLEQGFTLARAPAKGKGGLLTIALQLSGSVNVTKDSTGAGLIMKTVEDGPVIRYTGLIAYDATGRELRSSIDVRGHRLFLHVDAANATYPVVVDPFLQLAKLASDGAAGDHLGVSGSISSDGNTAVFGSADENSGQGAAYVFVKPSTGWVNATQTAKLTASDGGSGQNLGAAVAISGDGNTVVAGAPHAGSFLVNSFSSGGGSDTGAVYLFAKPANGWANANETAKLQTFHGAAVGSRLGASVSLSSDGNTVAAGVPDYCCFGPAGTSGQVFVYVKPMSAWADTFETTDLISSDSGSGSVQDLGTSVAMSGDGNTLVAGAPHGDSPAVGGSGVESDTGAVYLFLKPTSAGGWADAQTETAKLGTFHGAAVGSALIGSSVALSNDGSIVAAGVPGYAGGGYVFVYTKPSGGWSNADEIADLAASNRVDGDALGSSVSMNASGSTIVGGAPAAASGRGSAYVFVEPSAGWTSPGQEESATLTASDGVASDDLGSSVAIGGSRLTVVAGAPGAAIGANSGQGAAYLFSAYLSFSQFVAAVQASATQFALSANFTLGSGNNGINPLNEQVTIQVGTAALGIPPHSFIRNKQGNYVFQGMVNNAPLQAQIKVLGSSSYQFLVEATNVNTGCTSVGPCGVTLTIGDDQGTQK
jgi:hypothetical protein